MSACWCQGEIKILTFAIRRKHMATLAFVIFKIQNCTNLLLLEKFCYCKIIKLTWHKNECASDEITYGNLAFSVILNVLKIQLRKSSLLVTCYDSIF